MKLRVSFDYSRPHRAAEAGRRRASRRYFLTPLLRHADRLHIYADTLKPPRRLFIANMNIRLSALHVTSISQSATRDTLSRVYYYFILGFGPLTSATSSADMECASNDFSTLFDATLKPHYKGAPHNASWLRLSYCLILHGIAQVPPDYRTNAALVYYEIILDIDYHAFYRRMIGVRDNFSISKRTRR